jgi:hypothetical protein
VAKISFVCHQHIQDGHDRGPRTDPEPNDGVNLDKYEVNGEVVIKTKVGLSNRRIINWTSVELPTPRTMYEWEGHGIWEACQVMEWSMADFSVI